MQQEVEHTNSTAGNVQHGSLHVVPPDDDNKGALHSPTSRDCMKLCLYSVAAK